MSAEAIRRFNEQFVILQQRLSAQTDVQQRNRTLEEMRQLEESFQYDQTRLSMVSLPGVMLWQEKRNWRKRIDFKPPKEI